MFKISNYIFILFTIISNLSTFSHSMEQKDSTFPNLYTDDHST